MRSMMTAPPISVPEWTPATVYFECNDLDARVTVLEGMGYAFEHGPVDQRWLWREARLHDLEHEPCPARERRSLPPERDRSARARAAGARVARILPADTPSGTTW